MIAEVERVRVRLDRDRLVVVDGFLDAATCAVIAEDLTYALWRPSRVAYPRDDGGTEERRTVRRSSLSTGEQWFGTPIVPLLADLTARICALIDADPFRLEPWQAVDYRPGDQFDLHHDAGDRDDQPARDRDVTILVHMCTAQAGGATAFPRLGRRVRAETGRLLLWRNLIDGRPDPALVHAAEPLLDGRKLILTTWAHRAPAHGREHP
ncbi:2OG-Fe(II) oxygenase [Nocardia takedensis]|uniref:2OG-Fe(II) oxygenase n=1 Tax=Nocardia takedensis TaxID=259390 RepID=UPI0002D43810|nr:2OG-Fe(II) oxygenase [Nocardia takedensis]